MNKHDASDVYSARRDGCRSLIVFLVLRGVACVTIRRKMCAAFWPFIETRSSLNIGLFGDGSHPNISNCYYGKMDQFAKYRFVNISNFTVCSGH